MSNSEYWTQRHNYYGWPRSYCHYGPQHIGFHEKCSPTEHALVHRSVLLAIGASKPADALESKIKFITDPESRLFYMFCQCGFLQHYSRRDFLFCLFPGGPVKCLHCKHDVRDLPVYCTGLNAKTGCKPGWFAVSYSWLEECVSPANDIFDML